MQWVAGVGDRNEARPPGFRGIGRIDRCPYFRRVRLPPVGMRFGQGGVAGRVERSLAGAGAKSPEAARAGERPSEAEPVPAGPPGAVIPARLGESSRQAKRGWCDPPVSRERLGSAANLRRRALPQWAEKCVGLHASRCEMTSYFAKSQTLRGSVRGRASYLERNAAAFHKLNARKSRLGRC